MNHSVSIGMRLRSERERLRLTQTELAERGGVTKKTQGLYEGDQRHPDTQYLTAIAAVGIDVLYVVMGRKESELSPEAAAVGKMALNVGSRFRQVRGSRSLEEFGELIGAPPHVVAEIEAGNQMPNADLLMRFANAHPEHDTMWLMGGASQKLEVSGIEAILVANYRASSEEAKALLGAMAAKAAALREAQGTMKRN